MWERSSRVVLDHDGWFACGCAAFRDRCALGTDVGWCYGRGFRVVVLDPDWDHEGASYTTSSGLDDCVDTLEGWMRTITERGELPKV